MRTSANQESNRLGHNPDYAACASLFSIEHAKTKEFLDTLEIRTLKTAFKNKARQYQSDPHSKDGNDVILKRREQFAKIKRAYEHLFIKLQGKRTSSCTKDKTIKKQRPRIIAIGGAKGGIGKSTFASSLSVHLAHRGFKTIATDLDSDGTGLHLYFDKPLPQRTVNEYLSNNKSRIKDIMEPTTYGPYLIGGNSSLLGDCDISFTKKLKLLKAIRDIEADYIILDIGGQTSYNLLDFFLAADTKIVMADCNPDSLTQAYCFIKAALYRKLALLHGPQSMTSENNDPILKKLFYETTISHDDPLIGDIETLLKRIKKEHPESLKTIKNALLDFSPRLIINRSSSEKEAREPAMRIREVSRKKLSIHVEYLCSLPLDNSIKKNALVSTAFVSHDTNNKLARKLEEITSTLVAAGHRVN